MKEHARQQALLNKLVHIFDSSKDGLWYMGLDNTVQFYNSNFYGQFDLPLENSILDDWIRLIHPQDRAMFGYCVQSHKEGDTIREVCQYRALTRTGQYVWIEATGIMVTEGDETYMVGCHRDISQQKLLNEYLTHATYHNSETGLFNRKKWVDDIGASSQSGSGVVFAVSIAHLNHYQRRWGAKAIQGVVATITECLRSFHSHQYEIYRISSDVFVVWYHSAINDEFISCVGESLRGAFFSESLSDGVVSGNDVAIGIVHEQDFADQEPVSLLLKTVEYAHTHERISTYHGEVKNSIDRFFTVTDVLNDAIEGDQINIVLQPIVDPVDDKIFSFEALARWSHHELGGITPDEFIPIAEQQGLISALGLSVLRKACVFLVNYDQTHTEQPFVNVNVSVVQLLDGQFAEQAESIVRNHGLEPDRIVFEIT
ncbi:MAG: EAL domain-containing protein, partial [Psychromonas sp.]